MKTENEEELLRDEQQSVSEEQQTAEKQTAEAENQTDETMQPENGEEQTESEEPLTVEQQLEKANAEIADLNDRLLRKIAEFENYRKRTLKEKTELILNGGEKTITAILPVLDDMERALKNKTEGGDAAAILEGVELIFKKFNSILE
ncbi:MAG: nucleotide exchange factor GrpE, partial [Bacteroidaceae bacterium]|nr:nucleotide exchange factor GrpE [Bacteroidaceae bacterium]